MRWFSILLATVGLILGGVLLWDLMQERLTYPGKKRIIYAGMFGPGEPMQKFYAGPNVKVAPRNPFGPEHMGAWHALAAAWPDQAEAIQAAYRRCYDAPLPAIDAIDADLVEQYRGLNSAYVPDLVAALGQKDRANRMKVYYRFAESHPQHEKWMIELFEQLHPAYTVGAFEDFERLHPDYKVIQRWDGRWVLSANRPRFLTGSDVPDLITGSQAELRILMRENLGIPLDTPLNETIWPGEGIKPAWRELGILDAEVAYDDPNRSLRSEFYDWVLERARYDITEEDHTVSQNPYPVGQRLGYMLPRMVQATAVFCNRVHLEKIGRGRRDYPKTVAEFEDICRQLIALGIEPIAQDGMTYVEMWWSLLVTRLIGDAPYKASVLNQGLRFAGPDGDPRYLDVARRLRQWRDEGFWMKGFSASQWPGAQRDFGSGRCTFLQTGSWLPTEIAGTRSWDPNVLDLGCFYFPPIDEQTGDPHRMPIAVQGYVMPRDGRNHEGAVLLLRYLTSRTQKLMASKLNYIPAARRVPFPLALQDLEQQMVTATPSDFLDEGPTWYSAKWWKFAFMETANKFFVERKDNLTPEAFVAEIEKRSQDHYAKYGPGT